MRKEERRGLGFLGVAVAVVLFFGLLSPELPLKTSAGSSVHS